MKVFALALLALLGTASAVCPSACSGHGTCNRDDICTCYTEGNLQHHGVDTHNRYYTITATNALFFNLGSAASVSVDGTNFYALGGSVAGGAGSATGTIASTDVATGIAACTSCSGSTTLRVAQVTGFERPGTDIVAGSYVRQAASGATGIVIELATNALTIGVVSGTWTTGGNDFHLLNDDGTFNKAVTTTGTGAVAAGSASNDVDLGSTVTIVHSKDTGDAVQAAWTGADCSLRTCPRGQSWSRIDTSGLAGVATLWKLNGDQDMVKSAYGTHVDNVECSDAGLCDRSTGQCQCFDNYEGSSCQRTVCPNDCSGHGTCEPNSEFARLAGLRYSGAWDSGLNFGCLCDNGYRGSDCSLIECPSGFDPAYHTDAPDHNAGHSGNGQGRDCSGRGICDYSTGLCTCFAGYTGNDCGQIVALA